MKPARAPVHPGLAGHASLVTPAALLAAAPLSGMAQHARGAEAGAHKPKKPFPAVTLTKKVRGEDAIRDLGGKLPEVAAWYGMAPQDFAQMLRRDRHAWLARDGRLFYVDDFPPPPEAVEGGEAAADMTTAGAHQRTRGQRARGRGPRRSAGQAQA